MGKSVPTDPLDTNTVPDSVAMDTSEVDALKAQIDLISGQLSDAIERRDDLNRQVISLNAQISAPSPIVTTLTPEEAEGYRIANRQLVHARIYSFCPAETTNINAFIAKLDSLLGNPVTA